MAVRHIDQPVAADVDAGLTCRGVDLRCRTDQDRRDQSELRDFHRCSQRQRVTGMHHRDRYRRLSRGACQQVAEPPVATEAHLRQLDRSAAQLFCRRLHLRHAGDDVPAGLIGAAAVEHKAMARVLSPHGDGGGNGVTETDRQVEVEILRQIDRARTRQPGAEHGRDQAATPHAMRDDAVEQIRPGVDGIDM